MEGHLSVLGIGPYYVTAIVLASLALIVLSAGSYIPVIPYGQFDIVAKAAGIIMIVLGVAMWYSAVIRSRVGKSIEENHLVTDGIYAYVRNPIYSAITIAVWGVLLMIGNALVLVTVPLYWALLTVMVKRTEEKWLADLYGEEFAEYCSRVNRCLPMPPRR